MQTLLLVLHYVVCIFLMIVILVQAGKGAEMGAAWGGSSQTVFGSRGPATFFQKLTAVVAMIFLVTSIGLAQFARVTKQKSVVEEVPGAAAVPITPPTPVGAPEAPANDRAKPDSKPTGQ